MGKLLYTAVPFFLLPVASAVAQNAGTAGTSQANPYGAVTSLAIAAPNSFSSPSPAMQRGRGATRRARQCWIRVGR